MNEAQRQYLDVLRRQANRSLARVAPGPREGRAWWAGTVHERAMLAVVENLEART